MGYAAVINAAWLNIYYIVILAWCLFYFLVSLSKGKPEFAYTTYSKNKTKQRKQQQHIIPII